MSQKAHGKRNVTPSNCDCQMKSHCCAIKDYLNVVNKRMQCPIIPGAL